MVPMEKIKEVWFTGGRICMRTEQGKAYSRPLEAFPRLKRATEEQRKAYTVEMRGTALRWKDIDEDIHISSFYETIEPNPDNEVAEAFAQSPELRVQDVAQSMGVDESLLERYIYGIKKPSPERMEQLRMALRVPEEAM